MNFNQYVRKPFVVEAVEVTEENLEEVAKFVGEVREKQGSGRYIQVDRRIVPNVYRVYPGFFMTRMGDHIRCYNPKIFHEQFVEGNPEIIAWVDFMHGKKVEEIAE